MPPHPMDWQVWSLIAVVVLFRAIAPSPGQRRTNRQDIREMKREFKHLERMTKEL